ncbi:hypothetical protein J437_LFUL011910 [Ladona fulva]|uniref:PAN2-PAN3 deadenylation complex catalytic subunit PAN2 N-terminal domain-containing protein n=1 Tax=Ladona fulva TaxID=123851 RepID=A0A8K0NWS9_LADFU|nr:hypothetical protein J437_LFUL011910 [Ladona fulva]
MIHLRDPYSLRVEHSLESHTGSLSDLDVHGNMLVTCGFSSRRTPAIDPQILQTMKMVGTVGYAPNPGNRKRNQVPYKLEKRGRNHKSFPCDSRSGKIGEDGTSFFAIPRRYRKIDVKYSKMGADDFDFDLYNRTGFCGLEATLPNSYCNPMLQVNTAGALCLAFDVSSSCQCLAFGDAGGSVHLFSSGGAHASFNSFSQETEFADPVESIPPINILDENIPLSTVPFPLCSTGSLLSDWPERFLKPAFRHGVMAVDRFMMAYDLRMMRALTPISLALDPLLLRFLPLFSSRVAIVSSLGQVQLLDTAALSQPGDICMFQVNTYGFIVFCIHVATYIH